MKLLPKLLVSLLIAIATIATAQTPSGDPYASPPKTKTVPPGTTMILMVPGRSPGQARGEAQPGRDSQDSGYLLDTSTGLMWAASDNGGNVSWRAGRKYCKSLRLGGYSNWRMPSIEEFEARWAAIRTAGPITEAEATHLNAKKAAEIPILGPGVWSSSPVLDARGHRTPDYWVIKPDGGREQGFEDLLEGDRRYVMCVRDAGTKPSAGGGVPKPQP